jgi:very-short-patch-repair endonuclease
VLLAIEVDGRQHEDDPDVVRGDRSRTSALEARGWTVIRIRVSSFATDLVAALEAIRRHLLANGVIA